eukprot:scaffold86139_cov59-Phaeocystis_antarctica.AAC.4
MAGEAEAPRACLDCACCGKPPPEGGRHPRCPLCDDRKLPSTYFCSQQCQAKSWPKHRAWHKETDARWDDLKTGGVHQQVDRELAEQQARIAESSGSEYQRLVAEAARHVADQNQHRATKALRKAIALDPGRPGTYFNLGAALASSRRSAEAASSFLQAAARYPGGSIDRFLDSIAAAFDSLKLEECAEVAKPEWWNDEALKALSKTVVDGTDSEVGHNMRFEVLAAQDTAWESGPRSAADLKEAAKHLERTAQLTTAPAQKGRRINTAASLRSKAAAMEAAEAEAEAVVRAKADAKANAAADALLAEEVAEAAASAGKAAGKAKAKAKGKGKTGGKR